MSKYYGHGKLLLTGEYAVLDGALALALPTKLGQAMEVKNTRSSDILWESIDENGEVWFSSQISLYDFSAVKTSDEEKSRILQKIFKNAVRLNSEFLSKWNGFKVKTYLEFPKDWGLGSSSTLIHLVAQWADVNPLELHFKLSDGSGYDVASAGASGPIEYFSNDEEIGYTEIDFDPGFKDNLYFVYLKRKQSSSEAIKFYFKKVKSRKKLAEKITDLTEKIKNASSLKDFESLIHEHEDIMASSLGLTKVKDEFFDDYWGCVKSLGAWGGDFVMVTSDKGEAETKAYFNEKGYDVFLRYEDIIL